MRGAGGTAKRNPARLYAFRPYRDHAMMRLFLQTGLRLDELVQLERRDINLIEGYVRVRGKGDKERLIPQGIESQS
ncbi:MAG: tyrosine-type recombinase/integrase [Bacillota bacterium]